VIGSSLEIGRLKKYSCRLARYEQSTDVEDRDCAIAQTLIEDGVTELLVLDGVTWTSVTSKTIKLLIVSSI
jgi:hypothetical protein